MALLNRRPRTCVTAVLAIALLLCAPASAQQEPGEQAIKAAYLYNFTKFIDWPESAFAEPSAPFTVCVLAERSFHSDVVTIMKGEQVRGRPVAVMLPGDPADLQACHMAYFSRAEAERSRHRLAALGQLPVLTVGEGRRFVELGGLVGFFLEHNRVRFIVSRNQAEAAGLSISSKLLRVAEVD